MRRIIAFILFFNILKVHSENIPFVANYHKTSTGSVHFRENKGQVADQYGRPRNDILFSGHSGAMNFHLSKKGISYQLSHRGYKDKTYLQNNRIEISTRNKIEEIKTTLYRVDILWEGSNQNVLIERGEMVEGYENFYSSSCPGGALNVKSYERITYKNIYDGIDLCYYQKGGLLKYDYILSAGVDYRQIKFSLQGATNIEINKKGKLIIHSPIGTIEEDAPLVIQGNRKLNARWVLEGTFIRFDIRGLNNYESYVIDPMVRAWGTYYGGGRQDYFTRCSVDLSDNVYVTGSSNSLENISSIGSYQTSYVSTLDALLVKFDRDGVRLWGTYYGGTNMDYAEDCCIDLSGSVYISGWTRSSNSGVISSFGSHQELFGGSFNDAFLVKFTDAGFRIWGTYYGGADEEEGFRCRTDAFDNVYLAGWTSSNNNIASTSAWKTNLTGGVDAFIVKFDASGVRLWGTYFGGEDSDQAFDCTISITGNIYIAGLTNSYSGIASVGSEQPSMAGFYDAFLTKFDGNGNYIWGTYFGGTEGETGASCITDLSGNVYLSGSTASLADIAATGSSQEVYGGGISDVFIAKYDQSGALQWSTYYGGEGHEEPTSSTIDIAGFIYLGGVTNSTTGISTVDGWQNTYGGGDYDAFLVQFDANGTLQCATYYGGIERDEGIGCAADYSMPNSVYLSGYTETAGGAVIATSDSWQPSLYEDRDAFLVKFNIFDPLPVVLLDFKTKCKNELIEISWSVTKEKENEYFLIEHSLDGINFYSLDTIYSKVDNSFIQHYSKLFNNNFRMKYVRLLQKDKNGVLNSLGKVLRVENCETNILEFEVFPNPFNNHFLFRLNKMSDDIHVLIIDVLGRMVLEKKLEDMETEVQLSTEVEGLYFMKVMQGDQTLYTIKLIKQ